MHKVHVEALSGVIAGKLRMLGLSETHIHDVVDGLIVPSLRGVDTHGFRLFSTYLSELEGGRSKAKPNIQIDRVLPALAQMDADGALGIVAGSEAVRLLMEMASEQGIAAVFVKNSNHFGAASNYSLKAAKAGFMTFCCSNADALVAPFNGEKALFGTNPMSFAVTTDKDAFCLDMATSQVSYSKVKQHLKQSMPVHCSWAIEDASAASGIRALLPLGGYKGQGLAAMVSILAGLLNGAPDDEHMAHFYAEPFDTPNNVGHFLFAINHRALMSASEFDARLERFLDSIRATAPRGSEPVRVAGDLERDTQESRQKGGIPLSEEEYQLYLRLQREVQ
ncbi:Ldh family oxidoreductase [Vibrio aestuarianus]|uniref:Ldh family oxidoreductase n=1 Tax=Vibrio aestuarianus TaxID=28171 RepID=A0A9X4INI0_9VIBR|nr:Ldh family oxidoreductase [Vibrio aestuarianus]MDE1240867.1 Ldh family oxidoreductase [Vibrio aestuarianus]